MRKNGERERERERERVALLLREKLMSCVGKREM